MNVPGSLAAFAASLLAFQTVSEMSGCTSSSIGLASIMLVPSQR